MRPHVLPCPDEGCCNGVVEVSGPQFFNGDYDEWTETCPECLGEGLITCSGDECSICSQIEEDLAAVLQ